MSQPALLRGRPYVRVDKDAAAAGETSVRLNLVAAWLDSLTYQFDPAGALYWPFWQQALEESWPLLARRMGLVN